MVEPAEEEGAEMGEATLVPGLPGLPVPVPPYGL